MEDYIKHMQEYLNKKASKNDNNKNILETFDGKEKCLFQDKDNQINSENNQVYNSTKDKKSKEIKKVQNCDEMPLPTLQSKENNYENKQIFNKNNIDDIPIKGNTNLNFNELLEKELSKEENKGNYININNSMAKPKFKYIPKKRVDLISAPRNSKKYKYYSDNFKPKNRGNSVNITKKMCKNNNEMIENKDVQNNSDDWGHCNKINKQAKKRIAPVIPENFKNSKFNRGRGYAELLKDEKEEIQNNKNEDNKMNPDDNNIIKSLRGDINKNCKQKKKKEENLEDFQFNEEEEGDDEIRMNTNIVNSILYKRNNSNNILYNNLNMINYSNYESKQDFSLEKKGSIQERLDNNEKEDFGVIKEKYIKNLMNYNAHDVEDILNLNNKINSGNNELFISNINDQNINKNNFINDLTNKNKIQEEENDINSNVNLNKYKIDINNEKEKNEVEKEIEIEDDGEDNREIYKMFEDKLYQNGPINNNIKPQQIKIDKDKQIPINSFKCQQSRLINKYFGKSLYNITNSNNTGVYTKNYNKHKANIFNNNINNTQKQKNNPNNNNLIDNDSNIQIKDLVNEKIAELNKVIEKLKKDNIRVIELKKEYERLSKKYKIEVEEYNKKRENNRIEFEKMKEEERKKIEHEKKIQIRNTKLLRDFPSKKEREEIDNLKEQIMKLQEEMKSKEQRNKLAMDRLKRQLEESNKKNENLRAEIKIYENIMNNKGLNISDNNKNKKNYFGIISNSSGNQNNSFMNKSEYKKNNLYLNNNRGRSFKKNVCNKGLNKNNIKNNNLNSLASSKIKIDKNNTSNYSKNFILNNKNNFFNTSIEEENININNDIDISYNNTNDNNNDNQENLASNIKNQNKYIIQNNKNNDSNMFNMVFLPQYHSPASNMIRLIRQDITEDGKIIKQYENNKKEVIFPISGLKKELFEDGYQVSYFKNKDIKQLYPDGKEVYLYAENNTVVTKFPNGLRVFKFSNGQIEKNFPDGTKIVNYADGTIRNVYNDGVEEVFFNDGSLQKIDKNGIITVEYSDGIQDTIYPDESKIRKYPDGKITKINSNGSIVEQ